MMKTKSKKRPKGSAQIRKEKRNGADRWGYDIYIRQLMDRESDIETLLSPLKLMHRRRWRHFARMDGKAAMQ